MDVPRLDRLDRGGDPGRSKAIRFKGHHTGNSNKATNKAKKETPSSDRRCVLSSAPSAAHRTETDDQRRS